MTDKQIIIDGVDVSGCYCYVSTSKEYSCGLTCSKFHYRFCKENPNCYYKQLKRKEKSEEKLVKQIQTICDFINNRPETFKGVNGSVDKIITDYTERKEQECEDFKQKLLDKTYAYSVMERSRRNSLQQLDQLEEENKSLKKQLQFEFDETLLQYSNTIEDLQKQLKDSVMQKCPQCGETYLNPVGAKLYETLIEIKELVQSDYCTEIGSCEFCAEIGNCLNRKILHKISEVIDE